ncbi:MAG: DUF1353 domain-containing protein [Ramlibacter sp.]
MSAAGFIGDVDLRILDDPGNLFRVLGDFQFVSAVAGCVIFVPAGFVTDLASVPRLPFAYLVVGGKGKKAAVVHDLLYTTRRFSREVADAVFREALLASGYSHVVAGIMYAGVRAGGWVGWRRPNVPQPDHVAAQYVA